MTRGLFGSEGKAPLRRNRGVLRAVVVLAGVVAAAFALSGTASAAPWCGSVATADRTAVLGGKSIRVIYAIPSDGADQSAQRAPAISADIDSISAWWRSQDSARAPRFDLTPFACGAQADIVFARLPQPGGELTSSETRFSKIIATVGRSGRSRVTRSSSSTTTGRSTTAISAVREAAPATARGWRSSTRQRVPTPRARWSPRTS